VGSDKAVGARGQGPGARGQGARPANVVATVVSERPSLVYEVVLESQQRVLAHLVGNAKRNFVRLVPGDRVDVELSPHDPTRGKITKKL